MKRYLYFLATTYIFLYAFNISVAQIPIKGHIFNSVVGNNSEPVLYNTVNLNTYELLTTNIQVSKDDNLQKIVLSPLKFGTAGSMSSLRETKINFSQKDGISTFGIGFV